MKDIGNLFPDTDEEYSGISSLILLKKVFCLLKEKNYCIINIDSTIIAQRPKLAGFIPQMIKNIADTLETDISNINVKATTEEGLGFTGSGEGIAAQAVCLIDTVKA